MLMVAGGRSEATLYPSRLHQDDGTQPGRKRQACAGPGGENPGATQDPPLPTAIATRDRPRWMEHYHGSPNDEANSQSFPLCRGGTTGRNWHVRYHGYVIAKHRRCGWRHGPGQDNGLGVDFPAATEPKAWPRAAPRRHVPARELTSIPGRPTTAHVKQQHRGPRTSIPEGKALVKEKDESQQPRVSSTAEKWRLATASVEG
ncbi:uncharacterized protein J3D65DRAFT_97748 [Phyllosticta citribraziliensis]|uniref:Uncharacterized protein n=1 Tax=Phyllosticta citribraziliensis TaxID=989973 RepID=A0ABR1LAG5_9PEZI